MLVTFFCRLISIVIFIIVASLGAALLSCLNRCNKCGANCGNESGSPGNGSNFARLQVVLSIVLFRNSFSSKPFLFVSKTFRFFPGCTKEGALGNTARAAISPQLNLSGP